MLTLAGPIQGLSQSISSEGVISALKYHHSKFYDQDSVFHRAEYLRLYPKNFNDLIDLVYVDSAPLKGHSWIDLSIVANTNDSLWLEVRKNNLLYAPDADWKNEDIPFDDISVMQMIFIKFIESHPEICFSTLNSFDEGRLKSSVQFLFFPSHEIWLNIPENIVKAGKEYPRVYEVLKEEYQMALKRSNEKQY